MCTACWDLAQEQESNKTSAEVQSQHHTSTAAQQLTADWTMRPIPVCSGVAVTAKCSFIHMKGAHVPELGQLCL